MMLVSNLLSTPIAFDECKINVLVIENQKVFQQFIQELIDQLNGNEGSIVLSENFEPLSLNKSVELIIDFFSLELNNKKVLNQVYSELGNICVNEEYISFINAKNELLSLIDNIIQKSNYNLSFDENIDTTNLFKIIDIKINEENNNLLDKLINYLNLHQSVFKTKCFILINLKCFLNAKELSDFYKDIIYNKLNVILIENSPRSKIPCEKIRIIDKDLCEIY